MLPLNIGLVRILNEGTCVLSRFRIFLATVGNCAKLWYCSLPEWLKVSLTVESAN